MEGKRDFDHLTQEDKVMISDSWGKVYANADDIGVPILIRLFATDPSSKQYFSKFKDIEDLKELEKNPHLKNHARKVLKAINTMVENINNAEKVTSVFNTLGNSHALRHKVEPRYFKVLSDVIVTVLGETFTEVMTSAVAQAWRNFFTAMCANFNDVYQEVGWNGN
ncbi:cytoglobin-1-like [Gouania willdenowi]|uniref:superoxide dismutase n=1 Tax=Gouania willdenowi TaxID=441366 RepID=A0A8C5G9V2_GOUWI|nr:cytoglobin-1-like [Gouania willdenowi]